MKLLNDIKKMNQGMFNLVDLELALVQSICTFKSSVLGDPRILLMGVTAAEESIGKRKNSDDDELCLENQRTAHEYVRVDNDTQKSYNSIAQMMDNSDMRSIMTIFAEKLMLNLVYAHEEDDVSKRVTSISLDTLSFYSGALSSCRMLANTDIMQQIIKGGISQFNILQHPSQMKMLGQFYKIML